MNTLAYEQINAFLKQWHYDPEDFGRRALNDPRLVRKVQNGEPISQMQVNRVLRFMEADADVHHPQSRKPTLLQRIEAFCKQWGYSYSEFSRRALVDPNFVRSMQVAGRSPTQLTVERIERFMMGGAEKHGKDVRARDPAPNTPPRKQKRIRGVRTLAG